MPNKSQKILIGLLVLAIVASGLTLPQRAQGFIGVGALIGAITGGFAKLIDFMLDTRVEILKKRLLDMVVDQIVASIIGGEKPFFIQDWRAFFAQYVNIVTGDIVEAAGLGVVCRPFGIQLQLALFQPPFFTNQITCTLDQIVGNITNFYEDFRAGGFLAYQEIWNPQNNFYGALLIAMNEKQERIASELYAAGHEAVAGGGFLGVRKCVDTPQGRFCYIQTPGSLVGALAGKAIGSKIDWLVETRDFPGYVAAITDALIIRLMREGVFAIYDYARELPPSQELLARFEGREPGVDCQRLQGQIREHCLAFERSQTNDFQANKRLLLDQLNLTLAPLLTAENQVWQALIKQQQLVDQLIVLRDCQVGRGQSGKEQTIAELEQEETNLQTITTGLSEVNGLTTPLLNTKTQLQNPPSPTLFDLTAIFSPVEFLLNPEQAKELRDSKKLEADQIKAKVDRRLPELRQATEQCARS